MKKVILITISAITLSLQAQTVIVTNTVPTPNPFQTDLNNFEQVIGTLTNWTVLTGLGRSTADFANSKGRSIVFADLEYQTESMVGFVVGYDYLWTRGAGQANAIKGGVTLSQPMHLFAFIGSTGLTNVVATPFVADLLATPKAGQDIGNIVTGGINFDVKTIGNFMFDSGIQLENRMGQGQWNGNYWLIHVGLTRMF